MGFVQQQAEKKAKESMDARYTDTVLEVSRGRLNCPYCGRLICEGKIETIRIKCPSCKQFATIRQI